MCDYVRLCATVAYRPSPARGGEGESRVTPWFTIAERGGGAQRTMVRRKAIAFEIWRPVGMLAPGRAGVLAGIFA